MASSAKEQDKRLLLVLVADEEVIERFPAAVRYLQVGLIDEPIDILLLAPEHSRVQALVAGPTKVITYRKYSWPVSHWAQRGVVATVRAAMEAAPKDSAIIVHCLDLTAAPLAAAIAADRGAELVLNVASAAALENPELMRRLDLASSLITPADGIDRAIKASPLATKSAEVVPLGVETQNTPAAFTNTRNAPVLLFAGALIETAGVDLMFRAARRVLREHEDLQIFIIGKGPAEPGLRHLVEELGISRNVVFTGRLEQMRAALSAADMFCLPRSLPVFREEPVLAMAAGLAVIAASGVFCDGLVERETAFLFPEHDETRLAEQLTYCLENPKAARLIAATAQAYSRSHYSISRMVEAYLQIYRRLIAQHETLSISSRG